MTMPGDQQADGLLAVISSMSSQVSQILSKQGEQGEKLAVISEQLRDLPDHENRLRQLEQAAAADKGGRDQWARVLSILAALAAAGSGIAAWVVVIHH